MSLEEDLLQKKFQDEFEKAAVNILFTGSWLHNFNASQLKPFGITPEQYNVLRILRGSHPDPLRLNDIACRMIDKSSNATRLVEKLRIKGFVSRRQCVKNRRQVDIHITPKGNSLLSRIESRKKEWMEVFRHVTLNEAKALNKTLDKIRTHSD